MRELEFPSRARRVLLGALLILAAAQARALTPVVAYPVTITNGQALGGTFQQSVSWNPSLFATYESADLGNIRFCADSACATELNAWLEGCSPSSCAPTASTATAWVNLQNAVPAQGVSQIYIAFMDTSVDFDAAYWGESIDITPGLDNGALVFSYYNNGQNISNFTLANGGALATTVQTNPLGVSTNVITLTGSGVTTNSQETVAWYNNAISSDNMVVEGWINIGPTNNAGVYNQNCMFAFRGASASPTSLTDYIEGIGWSGTFLGIAYENGTTNTYLGTGGGTRQNGWFWSYTTLAGTAMTASVWNQPPELGGVQASTITVSNNQITTNSPYVGMANWAGSNTPSYFYQWRVRRFPPAGVLPTTIVSVPPQNCQGLIISNPNPTQATPVPYEQSLTLYPTTYATLENANLGNVRFCADSTCTQPMFAWLEGCGNGNVGCTPTSGAAQIWVKLTSSIPAHGTQTIYQCFVPASQSFDGVYWGESTDIAAGNDNGSYVFPFYTNGQSLTGMNATPVGVGAVATAGGTGPYGATTLISLTSKKTSNFSTTHTVVWTSTGVLGDNMLLEGWVNRNNSNSAMLAARGASNTTNTDYLLGERFNAANAATIEYENANAGTQLGAVGPNLGAGWYWTQGVLSGTALSEAIYSKQPEFGGTQTATTTATSGALPGTNLYVGIANRDNIAGTSYFYEWRVRHYFPGGTGTVIDSTAPTTVTDLGAGAPSSSTVLVSWSAPSDANYNPLSGQYAIQYASYTTGVVWSTAAAQVLISTSGVSPGAAQGAVVGGLLSNTTYFFYLWTEDTGLVWSPISNGATSQTLAAPINAATGVPISITASSVTVSWTALPATPQSAACEGYELDVSTTNFGTGTVYTSTTSNGLTSQLSVAGLNTGTTMYFRVATLNWSGAPDYVYLSSANIQISPSIATLIMGLNANVQLSTVSVSSFVVTNVGNLPLTLVVSGSTITAGSPWVLSVSSAVEAPVLQGQFNATQPASAGFVTAITSAPVVSGAAGGNYAGGQSGKALAPGASATMWFKFWAPTSTVAVNIPEVLQVVYRAVYP